ncbi:MAG: class I SAM-dependent methyltransferase, partial [Pseudomonadota bacterium]
IDQSSRPRILDLGCGPGLFKKYYTACDYVGIDNNARYIAYAEKTLDGCFILGDILTPDRYLANRCFDYIILNGVLHHLEDGSVIQVLKKIGTYLNAGGRIIVVDHICDERLTPVNRLLLKLDRGSFSRTRASFLRLFEDFTIVSYREFFIPAGPLVLWKQCRFVLKKN